MQDELNLCLLHDVTLGRHVDTVASEIVRHGTEIGLSQNGAHWTQ